MRTGAQRAACGQVLAKAWGALMLLSLLSNPCLAEVSYQGESIALGLGLEYLEDSAGALNLEQILDAEQAPSLNWQRSTTPSPNFGYTESSYWLRTAFRNDTASSQALYLVYSYPLIDRLDVYLLKQGELQQVWFTGDTLPHATRPVDHRLFLFPVELAAGEAAEVVIRIQGEGALQIPLLLSSQADFAHADQHELSIKTLYYGMMLVMVLYNLFLYFSVRETSYLMYVGFVASSFLMLATMHGVLFHVFYPNMPGLHQKSMLVLVPMAAMFACLFMITFLNLREEFKRLYQIIGVLGVFAGLCVLGASILSYRESTQISLAVAAVACFMLLVSGPIAMRSGNKSARYFVAAWALFLVGAIASALAKFGVLPINAFTENSLMYGSAIEAVLLSFALADRVNREREARFLAQQNELKEARHRQEVEDKLFYQSTHDAVTGLPNSVLLRDRLAYALPEIESSRVAMVTVKLANYDDIWRTLGQVNQEQLVKAFAMQMGQVLEQHPGVLPIAGRELCARLRGNSFGFIQVLKTSDSIIDRLADLQLKLAQPVKLFDMYLDLGIKIGVACFPEHSTAAEELVTQSSIAADIGKQAVTAYDPVQNPYSQRRLTLISDLRLAIKKNHLSLHFQPQLALDSQCVTGLEALVRWTHPVLGNISPAEFVPLAEQTGLIRELTYWVLDHALASQAELKKAGFSLQMSVNLSAANLHEAHLLENLNRLLSRHGVAPTQLTLEVTETAMMLNPEKALQVLQRIHDMGIKIALDDFGTGHCSLSYIKKLPAHEIKIDRSFIMDMVKDADDELIVATTIGMCHSLGYHVVAEGIEDKMTQNRLQALRCDYGQGYHFCRPLAFGDLEIWLKKQHDSAA